MVNALASRAAKLGAKGIVGEYLATAKNAMVATLYARLGFEFLTETTEPLCRTLWRLRVRDYCEHPTFIETNEQ